MNLRNLLPEALSDEAAFNLVQFFSQLASTLESHYFAQMRRYVEQMNGSASRIEQGRGEIEWRDEKTPF